MPSDNARQCDLARLFNRSQGWVSGAQTRTIDPMPKDLAGATAWGRRLGLFGAPASAAPLFEAAAKSPTVPPPPSGSLELEELRLKGLRADEIEARLDLLSGKLLRREEVEQREIIIAAEFRRAASEYPLRARSAIERHVPDSSVVERIVADLQPLAAELLNRADARQVLKGKSRDEIRAELLAWVEKVMEQIA